MQPFIARLSRAQLVWGGLLLGFTWGVLIRLWMRLISTDPEFTWAGTLYIVIASALVGLGVGGAAAGRRSTRRWVRRTTRVLGAIPLLLLSVAAGTVMVAFVLPATLATFERRWWKPVRVVLLVLSLFPLKLVYDEIADDFSTPKTAVAMLLYLALAGLLIAGWGSVVGSTRRSRAARVEAARVEAERDADRDRRVVDGGLELIG